MVNRGERHLFDDLDLLVHRLETRSDPAEHFVGIDRSRRERASVEADDRAVEVRGYLRRSVAVYQLDREAVSDLDAPPVPVLHDLRSDPLELCHARMIAAARRDAGERHFYCGSWCGRRRFRASARRWPSRTSTAATARALSLA